MNISSRQIDAFLALAAQRNFTRGGAVPFVAVGLQRAHPCAGGRPGLRLFDRSTRHVALTAEGENFHASALRIRAEVDAVLAGMRDGQGGAARGYRVAAPLAAGWLPGVLADFHARHPGVELDIADVLSEPCMERVASGRADFALAAIRADTPELQAEPFCQDGFHLVCRADHLLATRTCPPARRSCACWPNGPFITPGATAACVSTWRRPSTPRP